MIEANGHDEVERNWLASQMRTWPRAYRVERFAYAILGSVLLAIAAFGWGVGHHW
jgi:hypothetical protein